MVNFITHDNQESCNKDVKGITDTNFKTEVGVPRITQQEIRKK